eukprot:scaffold736_cov254-Pinguiococcus_pyrenoidosus.AAC.22
MLQTLAADRAETAPPCRPELGSPIGVCDSAVGLRCNRKRSFPGLGVVLQDPSPRHAPFPSSVRTSPQIGHPNP